MDTEQTPQTEQTASDEPTDADLIAASLEAGGAGTVDVEREATEAAQRVAEAATPKPPAKAGDAAATTDPEEPKIAAILRAREKAFQEREAATDYAAQLREEAQREAEQLRAAARKQAADDYEAELQAKRARFKEKPTEFLRELGDSESIVDAVAREGTAEWKAMRAMQTELAEAKAKAGTVDAVKADFDAFKREMQTEKATQARAQVEQQFLSVHASAEKAPYLHMRYDPAEIIEKAHAKATEWNKAGIPFAHSDVAEYLEHQARQRLAGVSSLPQQVSGGVGAQKVRANGSRTLSAATGSERRASPRPMHDMSPEEERDALIDAAREARRTLKADT